MHEDLLGVPGVGVHEEGVEVLVSLTWIWMLSLEYAAHTDLIDMHKG